MKDKGFKDLLYRAAGLGNSPGAAPSTFDRESRSVEVVVATEEPVEMWDYEYGRIPEVLLMSGCKLPKGRQIPLLDSHSRWSTSDVIGSVRDLRIEEDRLLGRQVYSTVPKAEEVFTKIEEGHLTDNSVGYKIDDYVTIRKGETQVVAGRTFKGPIRVVTNWTPKEDSTCPIGADALAKVRAETEPPMTREEARTMSEQNEDKIILTEREKEEFEAFRQQKETEKARQLTDDVVTQMRRDEAARIEKIKRDELKRQSDIRLECGKWEAKGFDLGDLCQQMIQDGTTLEAAVQRINDLVRSKLGTYSSSAEVGNGPLFVTADERDKFRRCALASLFVRLGRDDLAEERYRAGHDLAGLSLGDLYKRSLRIANMPVATGWSSRAAVTSGDLPAVLGDFQNKFMAIGYQGAETTWQQWCDTATSPNLHTIHLPIVASISKAPHINADDGEYEYLTISDAQETCDLIKTGGILRVSEKVILNDDLLAIRTAAQNMGDVFARAVNIDVYGDNTAADAGTLIGATAVGETMRDTTALFTSGHGNYVGNGSGGAPSVTTLAAGKAAMRKQKDIGGVYPLNWRPTYLIVPAALEGTSERELNSEYLIDGTATAASGQRNPNFRALTLVVEPLLDGGPTGAASRWYLAAAKGKTVFVFFHESTNNRPIIESQPGWYTDGVEWKGHIYHKAKAADWRGLYCNYGA